MKIVVISDVHCHNYQGSSSRLQDCLSALEDAYKHADKIGSSTILMGGDLFDSGERVNALVANNVIRFFRKMKKEFPNIEMLAISGNHDQYGMNTESLLAESFLKTVEVTNFCLMDYTTTEMGDALDVCTVAFLPYFSDRESFLKAVEKLPPARLLLCHNSYPGWTLSPDFTVEEVKKFDMVLCGHIHQHGKVGHVYSIGSPLPRTVSDVDRKGFLEVDLEHLTVTRIFTNYPLVTNNYAPSMESIRVDPYEDVQEDVQEAKTPVEILEAFAKSKGKDGEYLQVIPKIL